MKKSIKVLNTAWIPRIKRGTSAVVVSGTSEVVVSETSVVVSGMSAVVKSLVIPLDMDNVDTDMIIPAQYLTKIDRNGYGENLFQRLREQDATFVFNDPKYQSAKILLSKSNFGCGSSREHAVWAIKQAGIEIVIAESFSDIFENNAAKNGLLLIVLPKEIVEYLLQQAQTKNLVIDVDLPNQKIALTKQEFNFNYDPFRKECLLKGQDDLDYLLEATQ